MSALYMRTRWVARKESREDCAKRLSAFMGDLAVLHPRLSAWGKASGSPKKPRLLIDPTPEGVAAAPGRNGDKPTIGA
ncbi:MAG: Imm52 family immunity protein [Pseudoxanthomonas sp.]